MATKKKSSLATKKQSAVQAVTGIEEPKLDEQEEKVLDWILKGVVVFVLGWLVIAVLMVIGGYFHLWK